MCVVFVYCVCVLCINNTQHTYFHSLASFPSNFTRICAPRWPVREPIKYGIYSAPPRLRRGGAVFSFFVAASRQFLILNVGNCFRMIAKFNNNNIFYRRQNLCHCISADAPTEPFIHLWRADERRNLASLSKSLSRANLCKNRIDRLTSF